MLVEVVAERVAGLDVHKKVVQATARVPDVAGGRRAIRRRFKTFSADLEGLAGWLVDLGVTEVVMESTGVYWKPVWFVLEERGLNLRLVNARHVKMVPGRKTDVADADWLAELLEHGLLRGSFVPEPKIRQLRDLTRYRAKLIGDRARETQRVDKVLEDAGIKLGSVASQTLGVSGRAMLEALIGGERDPAVLAGLARGRLRNKTEDLELSLVGHFGDHHATMLRLHLDHVDHLDRAVDRLDVLIDQLIGPEDPDPQGPGPGRGDSLAAKRTRLQTAPGIGKTVAEVVLAETGGDMSRFPTSGHLASWAGVCPGNNQSAGKQRSGRTTHGDVWLKTHLIQAAWAASRSKGTYASALFWNVARRGGRQKAAMAVAHHLLVASWHILANDEDYQDLGADWFQRRQDPERLARTHMKRLEQLGYEVTIRSTAA